MKQVNVEKAVQLLKDNGFKYTSKRQSMLTLFAQKNRYLSAKDVQRNLKKIYSTLSYDTIYRNLYAFVDLKILEETELNGEKLFRFSCDLEKNSPQHHHHFICTDCGVTKNIHMCPMDFFQDNQLEGCDITTHRFEVFGKCESCKNQAS